MPTKHRLEITYRSVGGPIPYARNAKIHDDANVALIAGSIKELGFNNPVLLDGGNGIIAGHGRVLAARGLGMAQQHVRDPDHHRDGKALPPQGAARGAPGAGLAVTFRPVPGA